MRQKVGREQLLKKWLRHWGHNTNWLEPAGSKMVDKSTSTRPWATVDTHCNTSSGKWHTHRHHDSSKGDHKGQRVGIGPNSWQSLPLPKITGILLSLVNLWTYPPYKKLTPLPPGTSYIWDGPHSVYGVCISLNKPSFALLWLILEFFPTWY